MVLAHDSPFIEELLCTYRCLAADWFWFGMKADVMAYVAKCKLCQQHKQETIVPGGLLQPLPLPDKV